MSVHFPRSCASEAVDASTRQPPHAARKPYANRGRPLTLKHRKAIRDGIARRKASLTQKGG